VNRLKRKRSKLEKHMSFKAISGQTVCDGCTRPGRDLIEIYWASGNQHYCSHCWPDHRDYCEDEGGQRAWKRIGNYYAPNE
jgi:hypothetical protein